MIASATADLRSVVLKPPAPADLRSVVCLYVWASAIHSRMKRLFLVLPCLFLAAAGPVLAQDDERYPRIAWKVGDARTVEHVATTHATRHDSVLLSTKVESTYRLKVIAVKDTVYEVEFQDITVSDDVKISSDAGDMKAVQEMLARLLRDIQEKMRGFKYVLRVDRNTAQATSVKNEREMVAYMEETVMVVLSAFMDEAKLELKPNEKKEVELKLREYMKEQRAAVMQTVVNSFNYIFQGYSASYVPGKTNVTEVDMYYVDAIKYGDKDSRATRSVTAKETADKLTLDMVMNEDQRAAYQLYVVDQGMEDEVPFSRFSVLQRSNTVFDKGTTWIMRHEATVEVKMGDLFSVDREVSVFRR